VRALDFILAESASYSVGCIKEIRASFKKKRPRKTKATKKTPL
jgi:hypothetical protein